jgi:Pentapeptide repeats (8 copies)
LTFKTVSQRGGPPRGTPSLAGLRHANLSAAELSKADLFSAYLSVAFLAGANLTRADLTGAALIRTVLEYVTLVYTRLHHAILENCGAYGVSAWNVELDDVKQANLYIGKGRDSTIIIDNLEIAQFLYLMRDHSSGPRVGLNGQVP